MAEVFDFGLQQHKIKMDGKFFENNLFAVAGDTGRRLEVQLLDSDNLVQNTTGISLRLNADVAGQATYAEATLVDATKGLYELDLPNGMLIAPGNWQFQWQIIGTSGEKLHSFAFMGSVGSNLSEGGTEATNFYLNADELKQMQEDLINGTFNSEVLETNIAEKLNNLEEQYAPKLTEVTTQLEQKATQSNLDTQQARIDNLIANAGNGTVPSELVDIRIGADGITYQTSGEAVRSQFDGINDGLTIKSPLVYKNLISLNEGMPILSSYEDYNARVKANNVDSKQFGVSFDLGLYGNFKNKTFDFVIKNNGTVNTSYRSLFALSASNLAWSGAVQIISPLGIKPNEKVTFTIKASDYPVPNLADNAHVYLIYRANLLCTDDISFYYKDSSQVTSDFHGKIEKVYKSQVASTAEKLLTWFDRKTLSCYGDSITQMDTWQPIVKSKLGFSILNNYGIGGTRVTDNSSYTDTQAMCRDERINLISTDSDVIFLLALHNDWSQSVSLGKIDSVDTKEVYGALKITAEKLIARFPTKLIVFVGTPWGINKTKFPNTNGLKNNWGLPLSDYTKAMKEVAELYSIPFLDLYANSGINMFNKEIYLLNEFGDGQTYIHPNNLGGQRIASNVVGKIKTLEPLQ